jgi:hypothetical protein
MARKKQKAKWRQEGNRMVATLPNSPEDMILANRRANREAAKAAGMLGRRTPGAGYHGGGAAVNNRRDRREWNKRLSSGRWEDG